MKTQTMNDWTILKNVSTKRENFIPFNVKNLDSLNVENCLELRKYSQAQNKIDNKSFGLSKVMKDFVDYSEEQVNFDSGDLGKFDGRQMINYICWFYNGSIDELNFTWLLNFVYTPEKIDVKHGYILRNDNRLKNPRIFKGQLELKEYFIHDYGHNIYPFDNYNKDQIVEDLINNT